jgi:hypothetical protein
MPVFFAFSDESGKYKKERTDKSILENIFATEEKNYRMSLDAKLK